MSGPRRLLAVVRWPLGGIRTYMRYVYAHLGPRWRVTILAADIREGEALREDARALGAELILAPTGPAGFVRAVSSILRQRRHDLVQSQGFISAIAACLVNIPFRVPHVLTVHGVLEDRLLSGLKGRLGRLATHAAIRSVDGIYAVGEDILEHLREQVPGLARSGIRQAAIPNGIEPNLFLAPGRRGEFRARHGLPAGTFLFGFLGRFMPQKGFDKVVDALAILEGLAPGREYALLAVGSGDYRSDYERMARDKGVAGRISFLPFQRDVAEIYRDLDAVVMPSVWEACPLQPMEALVSGVPVICSDCIGLREVVRGTPAIVVAGGNPAGIADAMLSVMTADGGRAAFLDFRREAAARFDVRRTASEAASYFETFVGTDRG